jgi:hypothetical protein
VNAGDRGGGSVWDDAATGRELWRFNTIPLDTEAGADTWRSTPWAAHGDGATWSTITIGPVTAEVFVGKGVSRIARYLDKLCISVSQFLNLASPAEQGMDVADARSRLLRYVLRTVTIRDQTRVTKCARQGTDRPARRPVP